MKNYVYLKSTLLLLKQAIFLIAAFALLLFVVSPLILHAQQGSPGTQRRKAKLPPVSITGVPLANASYNFTTSNLNGAVLSNPTSLQFGPDGRLYVSDQLGIIRAFQVKRNAANTYSVTATEIIDLINKIPNHNDDGTLNTTVTTRQVTGILVKGTAANPVIYVSSSDSRQGGPSGKTTLDTNSGMVSLLSWNGSAWVKVDLVRGLPRSEENHATNGMQLDAQTNTLYLAVGGHTNAGSPSTDFNYACEYALSAAILSINLNQINAMAVKGSGNTAYKYDLPTLDDPTRANNTDGTDINDPFGGNGGLNQAKIVPGGPVQIYSPGYRNPYDLVITKARNMYTISNGANQGWGGYPQNEGTPNVTNNYVAGEPGSTGPSATQQQINNLDNLHYIGNIDVVKPNSYYGGHPNPTRANPAGAGLYTFDGTIGIWRNSKTGTNPLPADWPPVPTANPVEGNFRMPGVADSALLTFDASTDGIAEYTASNFGGALKGSLLAARYNDGSIAKISLTADGSQTTNSFNPTNHLNQDLPFASNFGGNSLDITTQGDGELFQGTVWVANYGSSTITVFEPAAYVNCTGLYNSADDDGDGYTNADEIDNGTNPCSAASMPPDHDHDFISDLNDPDDDNDGIPDTKDFFAWDADNGTTTNAPLKYEFFNAYPGTFFGLGFTGLMSNGDSDYNNLYYDSALIAGGTAGVFTVKTVSPGDALGALNTQENGFQFGVKVPAGPFTIQSRILGSFFNNKTPQGFQSQGIFVGTGDQDNYLKITLNANGGAGGIQVVSENAGVSTSTQYPLSGGIPSSTLELFLSVNPSAGTIQPKYSANGGQVIVLGAPIKVSGALLSTLQGSNACAVGIISTSRGGSPFTATWDYIYVLNDPITATGTWQTVVPNTGAATAREETSYVEAGNKFYLLGGRTIMPVQEYDPINKAWANKSAPPFEINHFQAINLNGLIYAAGAFTGTYPHETPVPQVYVYNPTIDKWISGATIPVARRRGSAGAVTYKNKIYMVCGITDGHWAGWVNWFDEYDPTTNTWRTLPDAPHARDHFHAVILNDKLYLIGGRRSSESTNQGYILTVPEVDVYDFASGQWSTLPASSNLPIPRAGDGIGVLGSEILVIGGEDTAAVAHKETHALNVSTNTWRQLADLQQGRHGTQAIVSNNNIYMAAGAGNQGGGNWLSSQESFNLFGPTTPNTAALQPSQLTIPSSLTYGFTAIGVDSSKALTISNTGGTQDILVSSINITDTSVFSYISPYPLPFVIPAGKSVNLTVTYKPTASGTQTANLQVNHSGISQQSTTTLTGQSGTITAVYRVNSGGPKVTNSIGTFAADTLFSPSPGSTSSTTSPIGGTSDGAIYQDVRSSFTGTFSYAFPVSNGSYRVILHFAEIYWTSSGQRIFDVSIEGNKVLQHYDIVSKVGALTATTETFPVTVTDGVLNIDFSSLAANGGVNNPNVSAIEILSLGTTSTNKAPIANAGAAQTITLPTNSVTLDGSASSDPDGTIAIYNWSQTSGPNTATFSPNATIQKPVVGGLVAGTYVFALVVTDNLGAKSSPASVTITVSGSTAQTAVYRINAGGPQVTNSIGTFVADTLFSPVPGLTSSTTSAIAGTASGTIYQTERYGTNRAFSYAFPVSNGNYTVVLHFAEIYWTAVGQRIFDVSIEGNKVLSQYDIFKKVGALTATTETFPVTVTDGVLNIDFSSLAVNGGVDNPKVSAIEILSASTSTNKPPVANAGAAQTITLPTNSVTLDGSASSAASGTIASYAWSQTSGPNTATFSPNAASQKPVVGGLVAGTYVFALVVTDNLGATSSPASVTITVNSSSNTQIISSFNLINASTNQVIQTITNGATLNLATLPSTSLNIQAITSPATVGSVVFNLSGAQSRVQTETAAPYALFGDVNGKFNAWTPAIGPYTLTATPYTSAGGSGTAGTPLSINFQVTNSSSNKAPIANAGAAQSITLPTNSVTLDGSASSDPDGTLASYSWSQTSGPNTATFSPNTAAQKPVVGGLVAGTYVFALVVTDNLGAKSSPASVTITVNPATSTNKPPIANAGAAQSITLPTNSVTLDGSASSDPDGTVATYSWSQTSGPNKATFSPDTVAQKPVVSGLMAGTYVFALVVTDNLGAVSSPASVTITVNSSSTSQIVSSFNLINASTNQVIQTISDGATLNLATLPSTSLNIQAITSPATVGSVVFNLSGAQTRVQTETVAPYALFGDKNGIYNAWTPAVGAYTLTATPYTSSGGGGTAGSPLLIHFNVINQAATIAATKAMTIEAQTTLTLPTVLKVYPNPSNDGHYTVLLPKQFQGQMSYSLLSLAGTKLAGGTFFLKKPSQFLTFDFSGVMISSGQFYLILEGKELKGHVKLMTLR